MKSVELTFYTRVGCSLCDAMLYELRSFQDDLGFSIREVDVDGDVRLQDKYGALVPVLEGENGEICHYFLDPDKLQTYFLAP